MGNHVSFRSFMAGIFQVVVLGTLTRCRLVGWHQRFVETFCFHLQDWKNCVKINVEVTRTQSTLLQNSGRSAWDLQWTKWRWNKFFPSTLFLPCHYHSMLIFHSSTIVAVYSLSTWQRRSVKRQESQKTGIGVKRSPRVSGPEVNLWGYKLKSL
jgi:hypothetical protein